MDVTVIIAAYYLYKTKGMGGVCRICQQQKTHMGGKDSIVVCAVLC